MEKFTDGGVCAPAGFTAGGMHTGINKNPEKFDVGMIFCEKICTAAAVYTKNKVKGAPLAVTKRHLENGTAQAVICNSVNANTCNADGELRAQEMADLASAALGISADDVIVASTGVIGKPFDTTPIKEHINELAADLSKDGSSRCEFAIMTTDTRKKEIALEFEAGGRVCRIGGIAKGSGMIHPNMATMLCFMTSDCYISRDMLQEALSEVTKVTFNRVSVDGDTSTNDMAVILADGLAGNAEITEKNEDYYCFKSALYSVMRSLAREIARDGEGATKLLECCCSGAKDEETAEIAAKAVISSSLFKSAMFGADANFGRAMCAIGYSGADVDINKINLDIASEKGRITMCRNGASVPFSEEEAKTVLSEDEIKIFIDLGSGDGEAVAWGCDLTYDYVKINADYRS